VIDHGEDVDESPIRMDPFDGSTPNEADAFEFNVIESTTPIPVSLDSSDMLSATVKAATVNVLDSMVPL